MLTDTQLSQIMRNASQRKRQLYLQPLNDAMAAYGINSLARASAFIAQIAHESGEFQFMQELWGPTAAQKGYEPPSNLARRLGNTVKGDGFRFKGRGPIQITGRSNYQKYGTLLGIDLISEPERAATPEVAFAIAGLFWQRNGLNALADAGSFRAITQRINGGQNGAADRERFFKLAKTVLASAFPTITPAAATKRKGGSAVPARMDPARMDPARTDPATVQVPPSAGRSRSGIAGTLDRGHESIVAAQIDRESRASKNPVTKPEPERTFDARRDTTDFRDRMYTPALVEVPTHIPLGEYLDYNVPILDQGSEGACTGFGLATVANYLLLRRRVIPDNVPVSARMIYQMARRYDEWPGEHYSGSSARGAMKGWHKHGVASDKAWPYRAKKGDSSGLTNARTSDARHRPLGAYFRVNHTDLVAMHSAIAEAGALFATCTVHSGWDEVGSDGVIVQSSTATGGHAFAIVAYDDQGFWLQNSWGQGWGRAGFGRISYDDWLENATDVWVARLGAPVTLRKSESTASAHATSAAQSAAYSYADLRPHIISVGNNGQLQAGGDFGSTPAELAHIFEQDIPRVAKGWAKPRVLLYAHGGLVSEQAAVQRVAEYRPTLLQGEVYPLAFIWHSDYWTTITNILQDCVRRRRPEGVLDAAKDFMLNRLDDALEPAARLFTGKAAWEEMKQNALSASVAGGAAVLVADHLKALSRKLPGMEIHMVGHSAGSIFHAPLIKLLADRNLTVQTCTLWAPACTVELFNKYYVPAMSSKALRKFALFALRDSTEQDDNCAGIYNKSLLYLVSNAFEKKERIPGFRKGFPLLGMENWINGDVRKTLDKFGAEVVFAPNDQPLGSLTASEAKHHGDFDDDEKTVTATFRRITGALPAASVFKAAAGTKAGVVRKADPAARHEAPTPPEFHRSGNSLRDQRLRIDASTKVNK